VLGKSQTLQQHPCDADYVGWIGTAVYFFPTFYSADPRQIPLELIWQHQGGESSWQHGQNPVLTRVF
jgi:hypothetical protein